MRDEHEEIADRYEVERREYLMKYDTRYRLHSSQIRGLENYFNEERINWMNSEGYDKDEEMKMAITRWINVLDRELALLSGSIECR